MPKNNEYKLFLQFLETYAVDGFKNINPEDILMQKLEQLMETNNQFLYIADMIKISILYTSKGCIDLIGIKPEEVNPYHFMVNTHPEDIQRLTLGKTKLMKIAEDLFLAQKEIAIISTSFRIINAKGLYSKFLIQCYLFYSEKHHTVFFLKIHTNIDWCTKIKKGYHYYVGNDMSFFRYPDVEMLHTGNVFSNREFEIIKLIATGQSSEQIAEKLFISLYTINAHRSNILKKTNKSNISELIFELTERGVI